MPPAARVGDMHTCPMVTGVVPHVGGPILPPGCPTVLVGGMPAARITDLAVCAGPPDVIAKGSPTVMIGNLLAARMGDITAHGGLITLGCPTVLIGESGSGSGGGGAGGAGGAASGAKAGGATPSGGTVIGKMNGMPIVRLPDGSIKVGNGIIIKGDPEFQAKTLAALSKLAGTPTGKKLLESIDKSGKTVTIVKSTGGNSEDATNFNNGLCKKDGTPGPGSDSTVQFNPDRKVIGDGSEPWMTRSPAVGLGHELIHAAHDANGTTEFDYSNPNKSPQNYELQAVGLKGTKEGKPVDYSGNDYTENKIRSDLGEPERPHY